MARGPCPKKNMQKERFLGQLRELLTAGASALIAYNIIDSGFDATSLVAAVVAIATVVWSILSHDGLSRIISLVRKALSASGGALVAYGLMTDAQSTALLAISGPVLAMLGSWKANVDGSSEAGSGSFLLLMGLGAVLTLLPSCTVSVAPDGAKSVIIDPVSAGNLVTHILEDK